jgi:2-polyprenyl-3-methyl-5-hydroxy-6-metoxy-1,4-benzoquinol methylase
MTSQIPEDLAALYSGASTRVRSHAALRWRSCPFEAVLERVPESGRILEVGCGHGLLAAWLAMTSPRRRVLGIDVATDKIFVAQAAAEEAARRGISNLEFRRTAPGELPAGPWNAILFVDVLYLLEPTDQERLLRAAAKSLGPGGVLLVKEASNRPLAKALWAYLQEIAAVRVLGITQGRGVRFLPPATQAAWLESERLQVEHVPLDHGYPHPHHLIVGRRTASRTG